MNKLLVSASVALGATSLSFAQQTEKPNFLLFIATTVLIMTWAVMAVLIRKLRISIALPHREYVSHKPIRPFRCRRLPGTIYIPVCGLYAAGLTPITLVPMKEH